MGTQIQDMAAAKRLGQPQPPPPLPVARELRDALATNLRTARLEQQLTQQQLADLSGVSRDYIGRIEKAKDANVSLDVLYALSRHVNRSPIQLLEAAAQPIRRR